jgi:transcriptional regulator with XRE-family HTH domain
LHLLQGDVAEQIGVSAATIFNWERNLTSPQIHDIPAVIRFLGYDPLPSAETVGAKLVKARRVLGLTQLMPRFNLAPGYSNNRVSLGIDELRTAGNYRAGMLAISAATTHAVVVAWKSSREPGRNTAGIRCRITTS